MLSQILKKKVKETKAAFLARGGAIRVNNDGRLTSDSAKFDNWNRVNQGRPYISGVPVGLGRLTQIGDFEVVRNTSIDVVTAKLASCHGAEEIHEVYTTRFCKNDNCRRSSDTFIHDERRNESICTKCGHTQKMSSAKFTRSMNDAGVIDRSQYNHGPANAKLGDTVGCPRSTQKKPYHEQNYNRIDGKIRGIAEMFAPGFNGLNTIEKSARAKLKSFYYNTHDDSESEHNQNMPHGGAAFAAACFYAATLEFEANPRREGSKTLATLAKIHEFAESEVDIKRDHLGNRTTRNVTPLIILRYTQLLRDDDLCHAEIPAFGADSLLWTPKTSDKEHARMALFKKCAPGNLTLPKTEQLGFSVADTGHGALVISRVDNDKIAYKQGFRVGDYILLFEGELVKATDTLDMFEKKMGTAMKEGGNSLCFTVMRREAKQ